MGFLMISSDVYYYTNFMNPKNQTEKERKAYFGFTSVINRCGIILSRMIEQSVNEASQTIIENKNDHTHYKLHQKNNMEKISSTIKSYAYFGSDLIAPGINNLEKKFINEVFDKETENKTQGNQNTLLNKKGDNFAGFCFALSLQFITIFFNEQKRLGTEGAVKFAGEQLSNGGARELADKQKSLQLLDTNNKIDFKSINMDDLNEEIERIMNRNKQDIKDEVDNDGQITEPQLNSLLDTFCLRLEISDSDQILYGQQIKERFNLLSVRNRLLEEPRPITKFQPNNINPGTYIIYSSSSTERAKDPLAPGHAIVYIRCASGPNYLYDPNFGTVRISEGKDVEYIDYSLNTLDFDQFYLTQYKPFPTELLPNAV
jgi:hypothetical protein